MIKLYKNTTALQCAVLVTTLLEGADFTRGHMRDTPGCSLGWSILLMKRDWKGWMCCLWSR